MTIPFDIEFPQQWQVSFENRNGTAAQGVSPTLDSAEAGAIAMVRVFEQDGKAEVWQVANMLITEMAKHYKNFRLLENTRLELGKVKGCRLSYTSDCPAMMGYFQHVDYLVLMDKQGYLLMTGAPERDFPKYGAEFGSIVRSFKLKDVPEASILVDDELSFGCHN